MELIANIFEILKNGKIISNNSKDELQKVIVAYLNESENFTKTKDIFISLGYELICEHDCYYLTKQKNLDDKEIEKFIKKHQHLFLALTILKHFYPAISSGSELNKSDFISKVANSDNKQIKEIIEFLTKKTDDISGSIESVLKILRDHNILEQVDKKNEDKHLVLNAIGYFHGIINQLEINNA